MSHPPSRHIKNQFMTPKRAKNRMTYGKKTAPDDEFRMPPRYKRGFDLRLSALLCHSSNTVPAASLVSW